MLKRNYRKYVIFMHPHLMHHVQRGPKMVGDDKESACRHVLERGHVRCGQKTKSRTGRLADDQGKFF
jgi:hypothetical protein